jgi:hypothetical protein
MVRLVSLFSFKCHKSGGLEYFYLKKNWCSGVTFSTAGGDGSAKASVG